MEKEQERSPIESAGMEALRKVRKSRRELLSSDALTREEKAAVLEQTASLVHDIFQAPLKNIPIAEVLEQKAKALKEQSGDLFVRQKPPEPVATPPDLSEIPPWQGSKLDGYALDYLKTHYGKWLSAFGAEQDNLYMYQIRTHDKKLIQGAINQLREEGQGRQLREFVKPRSVRTDRELASVTPDDLKRAESLSVAKRRRQAKALTPPSK